MKAKSKQIILIALLVIVLITVFLQFKFFGKGSYWLFLLVFLAAYWISSWLKKH